MTWIPSIYIMLCYLISNNNADLDLVLNFWQRKDVLPNAYEICVVNLWCDVMCDEIIFSWFLETKLVIAFFGGCVQLYPIQKPVLLHSSCNLSDLVEMPIFTPSFKFKPASYIYCSLLFQLVCQVGSPFFNLANPIPFCRYKIMNIMLMHTKITIKSQGRFLSWNF